MAEFKGWFPDPPKKFAFATDEEALSLAREIAGDEASVDFHEGDYDHLALRITGCFVNDAHRIAAKIERRLFGEPDRETGLYPASWGKDFGMVANGGFVAVWIR